MWTGLLVVWAGALAGFVAEQDGVRIGVEVKSNLYAWTVENLDAEPVTGFAIEMHHTYDFHAPEGWTIEEPGESGVFRARASVPGQFIRRGRAGVFSARVNSRGAILGTASGRIALADGNVVEAPGVWRPIPESRRTIAVIVGGVVVLALLHIAFGVMWSRRAVSRT